MPLSRRAADAGMNSNGRLSKWSHAGVREDQLGVSGCVRFHCFSHSIPIISQERQPSHSYPSLRERTNQPIETNKEKNHSFLFHHGTRQRYQHGMILHRRQCFLSNSFHSLLTAVSRFVSVLANKN